MIANRMTNWKIDMIRKVFTSLLKNSVLFPINLSVSDWLDMIESICVLASDLNWLRLDDESFKD